VSALLYIARGGGLPTCDFCGREIEHLPFKCRYCGGIFCPDHRLPAQHNCRGIDKWRRGEKPASKERPTPAPRTGVVAGKKREGFPWGDLRFFIVLTCIFVFAFVVLPNIRLQYKLMQVPEGYYNYHGFGKHENTLEELKEFLKSFTIPHDYEVTFDCSECSAYVEWALQNAGFNAYIAHGSEHAWIMVNTSDTGWIAIEATNLARDRKEWYSRSWRTDVWLVTDEVLKEHYPLTPFPLSKEEYYNPEHLSPDIYDAIRYLNSIDEFDWWNEIGYPPPT